MFNWEPVFSEDVDQEVESPLEPRLVVAKVVLWNVSEPNAPDV